MSRPPAPRLLLLLPRTSYRANGLLAAAHSLGAEVVVGSDHEPALPGTGIVELDFSRPEAAVERIAALARSRPLHGVFGPDEASSYLAACAAHRLALPGNAPAALAVLHDKLAFRRMLAGAGLPGPRFLAVERDTPPPGEGYPWVLKPRALSGSRGVLRVDHADEFEAAVACISSLPGVVPPLLAEAYLPGTEVALEGFVEAGRLHVVALFDKPDTSAGPTFAETLYLTPSRLPPAWQTRCFAAARALVDALGLQCGPLHAEMRLTARDCILIEAAARPIGGACASVLRMADGRSYETFLLDQALGGAARPVQREPHAVGVLMLPVPRAGRLLAVAGLERARAVPGIEAVDITVPRGTRIRPLPRGEPYLGFVFARAATPREVEQALRAARAALRFEIEPAAD